MAQSQTEPRPASRHWYVPRFSLAAALVAMTLCAVGLWYWYRVPFEVEHDRDSSVSWRSRGDTYREVETVRRTWGGTIRHGPRRIFIDGKLLFVENYRDGVPHGKWEWLDQQGRTFITAEFRLGRLESFQAPAECDQRLARHLAEGTISDRALIRKLFEPSSISFMQTPLKDAIQILKDQHLIPLTCQGLRKPLGVTMSGRHKMGPMLPMSEDDAQRMLDDSSFGAGEAGLVPVGNGQWSKRAGPLRIVRQYDLPVTAQVEDIPLIVALGTILEPHGFVCDYRYGMLWIAEREDANNWKDPTGVTALVPPPDSHLEKCWNDSGKIEFFQTPIREAFAILEQQHGIRFELTPIPPPQAPDHREITVTCVLTGLSLKNTLGAMLEGIDCQARLNGETIVIELQPGHPAGSREASLSGK